MFLSICIPTYNRADFLSKNINIIIELFLKLKIENEAELVISDNFSNDDTETIVLELIKNNRNINISFTRQTKPIPIYENQIFTVKKALGKFFIWCGDDDFINYDYLNKCLIELKIITLSV